MTRDEAIAVLRGECDPANEYEFDGQVADMLEAEWALADQLAAALRDMIDPDPCDYDHHGYCQTHGYLSEGGCGNAHAIEVLGAYDEARR